MYRVYDTVEKKFLKDGVLLAPNDDLYRVKKKIVGKDMELISTSRFIYQNDIGINDSSGKPIYVGDIVKSIDTKVDVIGEVVYADDVCSYVILDWKEKKYYYLLKKISNNLKIIGNVFEDIKED